MKVLTKWWTRVQQITLQSGFVKKNRSSESSMWHAVKRCSWCLWLSCRPLLYGLKVAGGALQNEPDVCSTEGYSRIKIYHDVSDAPTQDSLGDKNKKVFAYIKNNYDHVWG